MIQDEDLYPILDQALESNLISNEQANLRSKISSISRSIEQLSQKKLRIEFEIKRQKKSLARKREELKKSSLAVSGKLALESYNPFLFSFSEEQLNTLRKMDSKLLSESADVLEKN